MNQPPAQTQEQTIDWNYISKLQKADYDKMSSEQKKAIAQWQRDHPYDKWRRAQRL